MGDRLVVGRGYCSAPLGLQVFGTIVVLSSWERVKGVEPSTSTLGRSHSTTELHPPMRPKRYPPISSRSRAWLQRPTSRHRMTSCTSCPVSTRASTARSTSRRLSGGRESKRLRLGDPARDGPGLSPRASLHDYGRGLRCNTDLISDSNYRVVLHLPAEDMRERHATDAVFGHCTQLLQPVRNRQSRTPLCFFSFWIAALS
jgi:hypothetical protein